MRHGTPGIDTSSQGRDRGPAASGRGCRERTAIATSGCADALPASATCVHRSICAVTEYAHRCPLPGPGCVVRQWQRPSGNRCRRPRRYAADRAHTRDTWSDKTMPQHTFQIPFSHFRAFLPADGLRQVVWNGTMNRWKQNKSPFERHETAEVAFGRAIRAQAKHRKNERSLSPGIAAHPGRIHVRGGWAVHKDVPVHNDYFDGTFSGDIFVSVRNGHIDTDLQNFNFTWNASLAAKIVDFTGTLRNIVIGMIRAQVRNELAARLRVEVQKAVAELLRRHPQAQVALDATSIEIRKDTIVVTVQYEELPKTLVTKVVPLKTAKRVAGTVARKTVAKQAIVKPVRRAAARTA
ncbi:hypothetical protein LDO26_00335 [Luteimonas sp. BDR2-5]|uniref:hypothetical protein n=1 Tax=Proluteimonas luteida TaxID=2878685 RepID=UPI001E46CF68|nr:hypothetical protein [Luteimonas sp. BDR2-5]MCD9026661.1 hypothetical protein [Luteimonas sp. BDR2-5]